MPFEKSSDTFAILGVEVDIDGGIGVAFRSLDKRHLGSIGWYDKAFPHTW